MSTKTKNNKKAKLNQHPLLKRWRPWLLIIVLFIVIRLGLKAWQAYRDRQRLDLGQQKQRQVLESFWQSQGLTAAEIEAKLAGSEAMTPGAGRDKQKSSNESMDLSPTTSSFNEDGN